MRPLQRHPVIRWGFSFGLWYHGGMDDKDRKREVDPKNWAP
jgi:hypothetical protein